MPYRDTASISACGSNRGSSTTNPSVSRNSFAWSQQAPWNDGACTT